MGLGGIVGKLIGGLTGGMFGGGEPEEKKRQSQPAPLQAPKKKKPSKAGKLSLIRTSRSGVLDDEASDSGRGKLFGN